MGGGGKKRNRWDDSEDEKGSGESSDEEKGRRKPKPKASSDKAEEPASPVAEQVGRCTRENLPCHDDQRETFCDGRDGRVQGTAG